MRSASVLIFALIFLLGALPLAAQQPPETEGQSGVQQQQRDDDEEGEAFFGELEQDKVDAFAEVFPKVRQLEKDFIDRLRNRQEGDDTRQMQDELSRERMELIEDAGLTSEEYRQIVEGMAESEDLREYVEDQMPDDFDD